jgi:UDP-glucose 4-epimerase
VRVLVTGGAGYIGAATSAMLLGRGHQVVVLDDLSQGHRDAVPSGARFVQGSIADPSALAEAIADGGEGVDVCVHLAASTEAGESMRHAAAFFRNNTAGSLALLDALMAAGVRRFVLSSTAAVYGDPVRIPIEEDDPTQPTNVYGESKLLVERALGWLERVQGLHFASLRYFNAAGAVPGHGERHHPETHLIPLLLRVARGETEQAVIFGDDYPTPDGTCVRDYIHIEDLAAAHALALDALEAQSRVVCNLGNGRGFSILEVVESVRRVTGHPVPARIADRRPGDPARLVASAARAESQLGWRAQWTELDAIVASAWEWHRAQP